MKKLLLIITVLLLLGSLSPDISYCQTGNNVLLEFCTGTWCQWCPCGDSTAHNILINYPNTLVLAYHGPYNYGGDPFTTFNGYNIIGMLGLNAYPTGVIGRRSGIINWASWNNPVVIQSNTIQPGISIAVTKSYNSGTRQLNVTANCTALRNIDTACNINFVIYEDGVVYFQQGNGSCPGSSSWIHNWLVRSMVNGAAGEMLSTGTWTQNTLISRSWSYTLPSGWVDANCKVAVFAYFTVGSLNSNSYVQQTKKESILTGIQNENQIPLEYSLSQNYPNPFNPVTNIKFTLPKDGEVDFKVYDAVGNEVAVFLNGFVKAGTYNAEFDGSNFASGVYFYKLIAGDFSETKKMILSK
jgi:outer membrane protein Omp28/type IX secretion system substrate protein